MHQAFIVDGTRTPFSRYGGALSAVRADNLAAHPIRALVARHEGLPWAQVDDVMWGAANQAGEDNRNVARMAALLAGLPIEVPGVTVNRLCGSGLEAVAQAARAVKAGEGDFFIVGGSESMSRAPLVMPKPTQAFSRNAEIFDTTMGWRFVNPAMETAHGVDPMPMTAENVAAQWGISREAQDAFALQSQRRAAMAQDQGIFADEITPVTLKSSKGETIVDTDEHIRANTTGEKLSALPSIHPVYEGQTVPPSVTAGNASGINDGAVALLVCSGDFVERHGLQPLARVVGSAVAGVPPRVMGIGPVPATRKLLDRVGWSVDDVDVLELNEAFAAQALAVLQDLGLDPTSACVNPNGGAIALGHPLGASGARLALSAAQTLKRREQKRAVCTMCVGVGQGISLALERR